MAVLIGKTLMWLPRKLFLRTLELLGCSPMHLDADPEGLDRRIADTVKNFASRRAVVQQLRCLQASDPDPDEYKRITAKTLVIAGEFDRLVPHCYAKQLADLITDSQFLLIEGAGHNPFLECPDRVLEPIIRFLRTGEVTTRKPLSQRASRYEPQLSGVNELDSATLMPQCGPSHLTTGT